MWSSLAQSAGTIPGRSRDSVSSLPLVLPPLARTVPRPERGGGDTTAKLWRPCSSICWNHKCPETCYAHQPLWSAASWKGQRNHALILMGQKVPAFPFYSAKGPTYPPLSLKHREMFLVCGKQKCTLLTRKKYVQIIHPGCFG